ncbi:hypothetical protein [Thermococcus sp.]|uniref:hypothetical protein n=1 Tax=Thermococcus sp. TaxID=35749 RepID=UPI002615E349|nr:hypothetical protein [Thermococcus sp.]
MRRRTISVLILIYMISMLHTYALAFTWQEEVRLGEPILIYRNNTLIYNITLDVNRQDNHTYALIQDLRAGRLLVENIDWNTVELDSTNISIVSTRKDLQNKTALVIITGPDTYHVLLQSELAKNETGPKNLTAVNVTIPVNSSNSTLSNASVPANLTPVNLTPVVIPQNITCNSTEECQQIIANLTEQLKKLKAERDELAKQLQYLQQQLNLTQTENKQLKKQIKILEEALQEKNRRITELEEQIRELQAQQWSWKTFREKSEEQYLLWTPYFFPVVLGSLVIYYRRYKRTKKYMDVKIDLKAKELKEELLSEYLKKDLLKAKIETMVDDPNLLVILRTIIPQITGSPEITKGDILDLDVDQVAELARKKFLLKENRVEYLKKKLLELKEKIKEEAGENV